MPMLVIKATKQTRKTGEPYLHFDKSAYLATLKEVADGTEVLIEILIKRSLSQNKLLHLWLQILSTETGCTPEEAKVIYVCKFFGCEEVKYNGEVYTVPVSTSLLDKKAFANGLTSMYIWALENGFNLPSPDEYLKQ